MDRLCYCIELAGGRWRVRTVAPWPSALAREFSSCEEAVGVATIAARIEWERGQRPTCVCIRGGPTEEPRVALEFG
jgi:hypothetical protein